MSFRLGGADGVSVEAAKWAGALTTLGFDVRTVAGAGGVDMLVPGLDINVPRPPDDRALARALAGADLVVVENVCSLPVNPAATAALVRQLRGRRAILHHHDPPWQRARFAHVTGWPPDDPAWVHVTINELTRRELADRGIRAVTLYNTFLTDPPRGRRDRTRAQLGLGPHDRLLLQPTRAIPRKNIPAALALAERIGAAFWLTGPAEENYGPELERLLARARCRTYQRLAPGMTLADSYAAADVVSFPSTWEGFGNPLIEAAIHRRPLAVGHYPVMDEVARFGFRWFGVYDPEPLLAWLDDPDPTLLDHNQELARRHFSLASLPDKLASLLTGAGWGDLLRRERPTLPLAAAPAPPRPALPA